MPVTELKIDKITNKRRYAYHSLRRQILARRYPAGTLMPSANTLAGQFGISYVTMHSALSDLVRDGLLVRQKGKGTFTADQAGARQRPLTSKLVFMLPFYEDIEKSGSMDAVMITLSGASKGAASDGSNLSVLSLPSFPQESEIESSADQAMHNDGALFYGDQYAPVIERLLARQFPLICLGGSGSGVSRVGIRDEVAVMAVNHFIEHGYRQIGYFGRIKKLPTRYPLFCSLLQENGITPDPAWMLDCHDLNELSGDVQAFFSRGSLPRAVYVDNHIKALALAAAARERGIRIPEDLALIVYGTDTNAIRQAQISIVSTPHEEIGREGVLQLDRIIRGTVLPPVEISLPLRLVLRRSCGC